MLKSIDFISILEDDLLKKIKSELIENFYIELRINQKIDIYIVSNTIKNKRELSSHYVDYLDNKNLLFTFLTTKESKSEDYNYYFEGEKVSLGLRRSLSALLDDNLVIRTQKINNVFTFYSYKGGVGRTTSLALTATYLARSGVNVFVIDCDFEAPGLINFFRSAQEGKYKSGLVEYLNDQLFTNKNDIEDYIYNIEKTYSGSGSINLMPAGNVISNDLKNLDSYLEGLSRLDVHGLKLIDVFKSLFNDINSKFNPDVILVDSRTGFNNVFGALAKLSKHVVILAGDDLQNQPGIEYIANAWKNKDISVSFILSILSSGFSRRYNNFSQHIQNSFSYDADVFYFDRQNTLEIIGTPAEDTYDLDDFINGENGSPQYQKFFKYIGSMVSTLIDKDAEVSSEIKSIAELKIRAVKNNDEIKPILKQCSNSTTSEGKEISLEDNILKELKLNLPDLYAENIEYDQEYINKRFYVRPCMEDFFIPEKSIFLGDKGTGKTAFYKALQNKEFFLMLEEKAQKKHLNYKVFNVTNYEEDNFEVFNLEERHDDELFMKKFWIFFIWNAICSRYDVSSKNKEHIVNLKETKAINEINSIIDNDEVFCRLEEELMEINNKLKAKDKRLIMTFDRLDNIVKPYLWNEIISPLVKLCMRSPWENLFPKLFLRRDLYERLGNLTNKSSFNIRMVNLEWTQNEMFSYFLKIVFTSCKDDFFKFLENKKTGINVNQINKKLKSKSFEHNQLPLDTHLIQPIINLFFGAARPKKNGKISVAYEDLYRNIQSADKTVNLRPFIDLIDFAIKEQCSQDKEKNFRKDAILGLAYCTSKQVRKEAVVRYLNDLWNEEGNEFVKFFCSDLSNNKVDSSYKKNILNEITFENLLVNVRENHITESIIKNTTIEECKQVLLANKIITPYMVGSKTRYGFAYLYTNYFGI